MSPLLGSEAVPTDTREPPPVVALHCSASSPRQWAAYARCMAPGVRLIAPALGARPEAGPQGRVTAADGLAAEADRLWREIGAGPVHLVGHSFGAAVALTMALRHPQRVVSATLYEPILFQLLRDEGAKREWHEITAVGREVKDGVAQGRTAQAARIFCDYWGGDGAWQRMSAPRRDAVIDRMDDVAWNFDALFQGVAPSLALARLDLPVQVLCGQRSPAPARRCCESVSRLCPDATLVRVDGVGHMAPVEHPNRVLPLLPFAAFRPDAPVVTAAGAEQGAPAPAEAHDPT